jgi:hypothetical protein
MDAQGSAGARVGTQPGAQGEDVLSGTVGGDAHGVGDFVGDSHMGAGGQVGQEFMR